MSWTLFSSCLASRGLTTGVVGACTCVGGILPGARLSTLGLTRSGQVLQSGTDADPASAHSWAFPQRPLILNVASCLGMWCAAQEILEFIRIVRGDYPLAEEIRRFPDSKELEAACAQKIKGENRRHTLTLFDWY
jgi:hypothetical protein